MRKPFNSYTVAIGLVLLITSVPVLGVTQTTTSKTGKRRVFLTTGLVDRVLRSYEPDGSNPVFYRLDGLSVHQPQLSPNGQTLYFSAQSKDTGSVYLYRLNVGPVREGEIILSKLFEIAAGGAFSVFPDGLQVLVGGERGKLVVRRINGHIIKVLGEGWNSCLSGDGRKLAFVRATKEEAIGESVIFTEQDYFIANTDMSGLKRVTSDGVAKGGCSLSYDGSLLVFAQGSPGEETSYGRNAELYAVETQSAKIRKLTSTEVAEEYPSFTNDDRILFKRGRAILTINSDGTGERELFSLSLPYFRSPIW